MVPKAASELDPYAAAHPNLAITRFDVLRYVTVSDFFVPSFGESLKWEREQVQGRLVPWLGARPADVIVLGRELCLWYFDDLRAELPMPTVLVVHGVITQRWMSGVYSEALVREILARYRQPRRVVTPATHVAKWLASAGLDHVSLIPNPVDLNLFRPMPKDTVLMRRLDIQPEETVVTHVSNLKTPKRPLDIVDSAQKVLSQDPGIVYVIVGDGEHLAGMVEASRQRGLGSRFRFSGWVDHKQVPAYLNLADIVVMPSETETQALLYLETQACGRLLLASDIPAARQVVEDGRTGLLFHLGDVDDLTEKTLLAARNPQLRREIGTRAQKAVQVHSLDRVAAAYDAVLKEAAYRG